MTAPKKKESPFKTLKDVIFVYSSVSRPSKQLNKENKPPQSDNPLEFHAYEIKVIITDDKYSALKKAFRGAKNFPYSKELTGLEAMEANGITGLDPEGDYVQVKFSQSCLNGKAFPDPNNAGKTTRRESRPVGQIGIKGRVQDRNGAAIDKDTAIGNGTKGHLQFNPVENDYGLYLYPVAICITELVEYVAGGSGMDEDAFGMEELDEVADDDNFGIEDDIPDDAVDTNVAPQPEDDSVAGQELF